MYKIGLSTCSKIINEELFASYKEAGITEMEISLPRLGEYDFDYDAAKNFAEKYGINLWSYHLPFKPFKYVDISNPLLCNSTVEFFKVLIKKGVDIGIKNFIIHPSAEPVADEERKIRLETAKESLIRLAQFAKGEGATICVEDLPRTCIGRNSDEIAELISVDSSLMVCFDTNHLLSEDISHFIEKIGDRIVTTHISDYDFIDEKHWLPGEGQIDWQALIKALEKVNYKGVWLYEVGFESAKMPRSRLLNCKDFVNNANAIFDNRLAEFKI